MSVNTVQFNKFRGFVNMVQDRKNAVIYNRVSTQDQIDRTDLHSLISHEERCLHYIPTLSRCSERKTRLSSAECLVASISLSGG
jgi:hypothetical protein